MHNYFRFCHRCCLRSPFVCNTTSIFDKNMYMYTETRYKFLCYCTKLWCSLFPVIKQSNQLSLWRMWLSIVLGLNWTANQGVNFWPHGTCHPMFLSSAVCPTSSQRTRSFSETDSVHLKHTLDLFLYSRYV